MHAMSFYVLHVQLNLHLQCLIESSKLIVHRLVGTWDFLGEYNEAFLVTERNIVLFCNALILGQVSIN